MQHLPAMKLAEHLQDAGDLPACGSFVELASGAVQKSAQVAMPRVLEGQAVERSSIRLHDGKRVEDSERAGVVIEQLAEVGLAQPAVDAAADLDAKVLGYRVRAADASREIDLAETALAEQAIDAISEPGLRAGELVAGRDELVAPATS